MITVNYKESPIDNITITTEETPTVYSRDIRIHQDTDGDIYMTFSHPRYLDQEVVLSPEGIGLLIEALNLIVEKY